MEPAELAIEAVKEALRRGFPIAAKRLDSRAILVRNDRGRGILYASLIDGNDGCRSLVLDSDYVSIWGVGVAKICDGEAKYFPYMVPSAVSHHPHLLSTFEADVWSRRLRLLDEDRLVAVEKIPSVLSPFLTLGARVMYLPDTMDYVVKRGDIVVAWYNEFTRRLDDATKYLLAMGLLHG